MRIIINALNARQGGGQTYIKNLLSHLPNDIDLHIILYVPNELVLPQDPRIERIKLTWPTYNPLFRFIWEKFFLRKILERSQAHMLFCPGGIMATKVPDGCKTATMFRNMMPFDKKVLLKLPFGYQKLRNFILKRAMLKSMAQADLTIFISNFAKDLIENKISLKNAVIIPHGINEKFKFVSDASTRPEWLSKKEYILYVSRFDIYKHQMEVVQAYALLPADLREKYSLILIGETNNSLAKKVKCWIDKNRLNNDVIIKGAVNYEDLPVIYKHAAVNIFASSCENCPNIMLEALAAGKPVISSSIMPMPEFGKNSVLYFSPYDPKSLKESLVSVLNNSDLYNKLSETAKIKSLEYDWSQTADRTWKSIEKIAKS